MLAHARELLAIITESIPPKEPGQHHSLTLSDHAPSGLQLTLVLGDVFLAFNLSETDLQEEPGDLAKRIIEMKKTGYRDSRDD
jgi:hypothetical protein